MKPTDWIFLNHSRRWLIRGHKKHYPEKFSFPKDSQQVGSRITWSQTGRILSPLAVPTRVRSHRWATAAWTSPWWQPALPPGAWCGHSRHRASLSAATSLRMFFTSSFLKRTKWILFGTPFLWLLLQKKWEKYFSTVHYKETVFKTILEVCFKLI